MTGRETPHPEPPRDFAERDLPLRRVDGPWFRFHPRDRDPIHFGRARRFRFDAPDGSYGVLYAGASVDAAFLETFLNVGSRLITTGALDRRHLALLDASRPLRVLDLAAEGALARIGADARIFAGDRTVAQRWSAAIHESPRRIDGIVYPARTEPGHRALAIFDRAADALGADLKGSLLDEGNRAALGRILETYGLGLLEVR